MLFILFIVVIDIIWLFLVFTVNKRFTEVCFYNANIFLQFHSHWKKN